MALDRLVFGILALVIGVILVKLKRRAYRFYDVMLDTLSPDKPTPGLSKLHKIPYVIFMWTALIAGVYFILWGAYTALRS
ncbi:hypothetical protein [Arthrobacter sedimenti]|uniref:hypothetical protein n=1 Tax=Arthrobacter sedimenti TaxID=2694931 RepID=UPI00111EB5F5|nr:hypothetical protein [Arthrobacter sedimenti]